MCFGYWGRTNYITNNNTYINYNFNNINNSNINIGWRGDAQPEFKNASVIRINNEGEPETTVELKTPGGVFSLGTQIVAAGDMDDIQTFHAVYDIFVNGAGRSVVVRNVKLTEAVEVNVTNVFANDFSDIPTDPSYPPIGPDAKATDYLTPDILEDITKVEGISESDKLGDVLAKIDAISDKKLREQNPEVANRQQ